MTIPEEIEVLPLSLRTALHPILPVTLNRNEHMTVALIDHSPSVARKYTLVVWIYCGDSITSVKCPCCGKKVPGIVQSRIPGDCLHTFL